MNSRLLLFCLLTVKVWGSTEPLAESLTVASTKKNQHIEKLAQDLVGTKKSLINDEVKQRKVMSSLYEINRKMKKIVSERGSLVQERMQLEGLTTDLAAKIEALEAKVKIQKSFLRDRLAVIYRFGGQGVARLMFSSRSSSEIERNLKILGVIAKRDLDQIKDYSSSVTDLAKKKTKLTQRLDYLKGVESKIRGKEQKLTQENDIKNRILDGIRKSQKFSLTKLSDLREKTAQMSQNDDSGVLDLLFQPSFFEQKGQLPSPLPTSGALAAKITQEFGLIKDEDHNVILSHKGVFFSAAPGSLVKSVFGGKISYVGEVPGYGNTVIVDHGDHYYTVYGHNQLLSVSVGQEVAQNQILATSGSSSDQFGPGLYFEVRHFSEPYDPRSWMKGSL